MRRRDGDCEHCVGWSSQQRRRKSPRLLDQVLKQGEGWRSQSPCIERLAGHAAPKADLALSLENLQVLCAECNHGKGNWDMTDWRTESEA